MGSERRAESVADAPPPPEEWDDAEATERLDGLRRWAGEEDAGEAAAEGEAPNGGRGGRWLLVGGVRPAISLSLFLFFGDGEGASLALPTYQQRR